MVISLASVGVMPESSSFFICRPRNCRMHGRAHVRSCRNRCFPGFRNSVWIFMSDHLDLAAVDGISVSLSPNPLFPSFSRVPFDTLLFFSTSVATTTREKLLFHFKHLEFIYRYNGYSVAFAHIGLLELWKEIGIGTWTRVCELICAGQQVFCAWIN